LINKKNQWIKGYFLPGQPYFFFLFGLVEKANQIPE
jgi:hypothetical protein